MCDAMRSDAIGASARVLRSTTASMSAGREEVGPGVPGTGQRSPNRWVQLSGQHTDHESVTTTQADKRKPAAYHETASSPHRKTTCTAAAAAAATTIDS